MIWNAAQYRLVGLEVNPLPSGSLKNRGASPRHIEGGWPLQTDWSILRHHGPTEGLFGERRAGEGAGSVLAARLPQGEPAGSADRHGDRPAEPLRRLRGQAAAVHQDHRALPQHTPRGRAGAAGATGIADPEREGSRAILRAARPRQASAGVSGGELADRGRSERPRDPRAALADAGTPREEHPEGAAPGPAGG